MSLFNELKRRNVFRVGIAYVVAAWLLLQIADVVLNNISAPEWVFQAIMLVLGLGFPLALIFAWAFEMTPEGIKKEKDVDRSQSVTHKTGRKLDFMIIGVLVVALGYFIWESRFTGESDEEPTNSIETAVSSNQNAQSQAPESTNPTAQEQISIAVLPFVNMSADADNEYFSDGVAEEILNVLARIPTLKVAARTSAFQYKGENRNIAQIAQELNVNNVLEGSVRKSGNQVRVTAQLIKAADGFHLWSDTYDRELTNIFEIQDEIAESIATALKVQLSLDPEKGNFTGTTSTEAYDLYLRGVNQWHLRTLEALQNAAGLFEEAISIDPAFARAHAGLALVWAVMPDYSDIPYASTSAKTKIAAEAALAIDPNLAEAVTALIYSTDDVSEQLGYGKAAIALNPSYATAHQWYSSTLEVNGEKRAAVAEMELAYELDPRSLVIGQNLGWHYYTSGDLDRAERAFQEVLSHSPNAPGPLQSMFVFKLVTGDRQGAEQVGAQLARALNRERNVVDVYIDMLFEPTRNAAAAEEIFSYPTGDWWNPGNPALVDISTSVQVYEAAGEFEKALDVLKKLEADYPLYRISWLRLDRNMPEFVCHPDVQAVFANSDLPPLKEPYPCAELLP